MSETFQNITKKHQYLYLLLIASIGLIVRFYYFPHDIPIANDGYYSFVYSMQTIFEGTLPVGYTTTNTGWANFLSLIFLSLDKSDPEFLMSIQRSCSILFSVLIILPAFYIFKRFFDPKLALLPCFLLIIEPRLLLISLEGINYSFYFFLFVLIIALFLKHTNKSLFLCFSLLGIITLVRYEGLLLLIPLTIFYFLKSKNKKSIYKYLLMIFLFSLIVVSMASLRIDATENICYTTKISTYCGQDGIVYNFLTSIDFYHKYIISGEQIPDSLNSSYDIHREVYNKPGQLMITESLIESFSRLFKFVGLSTLPFFVILLPLSFILFLKNKKSLKLNFDTKVIIFTTCFMLLPSIYAYARGIDEGRYVLVLIPLFCILSISFLRNSKIQFFKNQKTLLLIILLASFLSIGFIEYEKSDYIYEVESFKVAKEILTLTNSMNNYPSSGYVKVAKLVNEWPELPLPDSNALGKIINPYGTFKLSTEKFSNLENYIQEAKKLGIEYIVIAPKDSFFNELKEYPEKYNYLTKIFDSKDFEFNNEFLIYKISI